MWQGKALFFPRQAAQHPVDQPCEGTPFDSLGLLHRLVDGGGIGHAVQIENLVGGTQQQRPHLGVQLFPGIGKAAPQEVLQGQAALQHPVKDGGGQPRVPGIQPGGTQRLVDDDIGVALVLFHLQQGLGGRVAWDVFHSAPYSLGSGFPMGSVSVNGLPSLSSSGMRLEPLRPTKER